MFHDTSHPSIETPVSAALLFPSPPGPADNSLPALTTPSPEGSTSMNHQIDTSAQAATTTATTGLTRSNCHSLPPSLPLFNISKPLGSNYNELYISYRVNPNATDLKNRESNLTPYLQQAFDFT